MELKEMIKVMQHFENGGDIDKHRELEKVKLIKSYEVEL